MLENKINSIKKYIGGAVIGLSLAVVPVAYEPAAQFVSKDAQSQTEVYNGFDGQEIKMGFDKADSNKGFDEKIYNGFDEKVYNGFDGQEIKMGFDKVDPNKGFDVYKPNN